MKKFIIKTFLFCILILGLILSCEIKDSENNCNCNIIQVNYGTSFGMCLGYCKHDLILQQGIMTFKKSGWADTIVPKQCNDALADSTWSNFQTGLDIDAFFSLPTTIGCPDCADGGAEWIELDLKNGVKRKVTFEYHNEPALLKDFVAGLRELMSNSGQNCP